MDKSMDKSVQTLIEKLPEVIVLLRQNNELEAYKKMTNIFTVLNSTMLSFVSEVPVLNQMGVDIPADVLLRQVKNLAEGYEFRDNVLLADTLEYEIMDSLGVYHEILEQL